MNRKVRFVVHSLRFAGLFNLTISMHYVFEIGVSTTNAAGVKSGRIKDNRNKEIVL
jgi:hypothetical protein